MEIPQEKHEVITQFGESGGLLIRGDSCGKLTFDLRINICGQDRIFAKPENVVGYDTKPTNN